VSRRLLALILPAMLVAATAPVVSQPARAAATTRARPAVVEVRTIGHTVRNRPIYAWRLGQPGARRRVVVLGAMHGNETGPSRILYDLRDGRPLSGADVWVVPQYNRDGIARHTLLRAIGARR
jgi:protein MpaA